MSAWIISATLTNEKLRACLSWRPLVFTGRISYGWYLWHYPIITIFSARIFHHGFIVLVLIAYVMAALSYKYIERPVLLLKRRFGSALITDEIHLRPAPVSAAIPDRGAHSPQA
jgi:peptidoglycan/LPS O-acetylase OafA/YrhL